MEYTPEQERAVVRVLRLEVTDYYGHLLVKKTSTSVEIKKAYRKQALIMHPDKNKAPRADEAFKRISKAFQVLGDENRRRIYDQTGADPDSRHTAQPNPRGGNFRHGFRPQPANFADPNDIFMQFFGPPGGGAAPFTFYMDGGDIFEIFRNAARGHNNFATRQQANANNGTSSTSWWIIIGLLAFYFLPTIFGFFFADGDTKLPRYSYESHRPYTEEHFTPKYNVKYFMNPKDSKKLTPQKQRKMARMVENQYVSMTKNQCKNEYLNQQMDMQNAVGWFSTDQARYDEARARTLPHCELLEDLGIRLQGTLL